MLRAGTYLGPYEIVAPLGAGGMGEVYRARDTRLDRDVAIKVLPPEYASDSDRLRRFDQEARAAGQLNHPNIVALYDIGAHEGTPYIVTELLEGESLREKLTGSPLPPRKVLGVAIQVASGLAAAHEKGIVHRDLKPENIFVTRDGQAKILDFGVAKLAPRRERPAGPVAPTVVGGTDPGLVMGTAGYMSPEQVRGLPVDNRSDIFSLGCVLYEMVTGRRAFARATAADTMSAILSEEPPDPSSLEKAIPAPLSRAIAHCLEKSPDERFHSAHDLGFELRAILADTGAARARPGMSGLRRRRGAWLAAGGIAIVLVAVGAFVVRRGRTPEPSPTLDPKRIVVAVFENQTGDKSLDPLGRMASDWVTNGLSRVEGLDVVPSTSVLFARPAGGPQAPADRDPLRALGELTGAGTVVSGAYYVQGPTLQFQAKVMDVAHGKLMYALDPVKSPITAPMEAINAVRQRVMGAMAVKLEAVHSYLEGPRPPLYDAYREFIVGFERFGTDDTEALQHFERAVQVDPDFVVPLFYEAYIRHVRGEHARVETILRTLSERRDQLSPYARHWLDVMVAYAAHRYEEALQHIQATAKLAPRDPIVVEWIGMLGRFSNHPQRTVDAYDGFGGRPWQGHPLDVGWMSNLCGALHMLGRHARELEEARRAEPLYPDPLNLAVLEVRALAALGRVEEVNRLAGDSLSAAIRDTAPGDVLLEAAVELRAHGHRQASLNLAEQAARWYRGRLDLEPATPVWTEGLMDALRWAERWDDAQAVCRTLVEKAADDVRWRGILGAITARLGRADEALRMHDGLRRTSQRNVYGLQTYHCACISALLGDKGRAMEELRQALAEGLPYGIQLHREIDLESLWDYPPFRELLKPKG